MHNCSVSALIYNFCVYFILFFLVDNPFNIKHLKEDVSLLQQDAYVVHQRMSILEQSKKDKSGQFNF